jgi:hypothetical protein
MLPGKAWALAVATVAMRLKDAHMYWDGVTRTNLPSLKVGTFEGESNVVSKGLVTDDWKSAETLILGFQYKVHFYVEAEKSDTAAVEVSGVSVTTNQTWQLATAELSGALPGKADVWVEFSCDQAGQALVSVTLNLAEPFLSPTWTFRKNCRSDEHSGLQVGTYSGGSDVVKQGVTVWPATHVVHYETFVLPLFVSLTADPTAQILAPEVSVTAVNSVEEARALVKRATLLHAAGRWGQGHSARRTSELARATELVRAGDDATRTARSADQSGDVVSIQGQLASGGILQNNGTSPSFAVVFNCPRPGSFAVEIDIDLFPSYQPYRPVPISFVKVCGGAAKPGFHVGVTEGGAELIKDGALVGSHPDIDNVADQSALYVTYEALSIADADQSPKATVKCLDVDGEAVLDLNVKATPESLAFEYECLRAGTAVCELTFSLTMWQVPAPLKWTKECGGLRKDIVATSTLESFPVAYANGAVHPDWAVTMPWDEHSLDLVFNASVPVHATASVDSDLEFEVAPSKALIAPEGTKFTISTNCSGELEGQYPSMFRISMAGYETIEIPFQKACKEPKLVTFADSKTAMAGTILFFIVVVGIPLSLVVFCVVRATRQG